MVENTNLKNIWWYDPDTGFFHWKIRTKGKDGIIWPGDQVGSQTIKGYITLGHRKKLYRANRTAWFFMTGRWPPRELQVEHRNSNKADNRWANLGLVTRTKNRQNLNDPLNKKNISGCRGVTFHVGRRNPKYKRWRVAITMNKQQIFLGYFVDLQDAIAARKKAELEYFEVDRQRKLLGI
jgi:HNH endonuclease